MSETAAEVQKALDNIAGQIKSKVDPLATKVEGLSARFQEFETNTLTSFSGRSHSAPKSIAHQVAKSDAFQAFKSRDAGSFRVRLETSLSEIKNLTSTQFSPDSPPTGYNVQPARADGLTNYGFRRLSVIDAMTRVQLSSNTFEHVRVGDYTDQADYQLTEGSNKAVQSIAPEVITSNVATIAVVQPVSRQLLDDVPVLQNTIGQILAHGCMKQLEAELISGNGGQGRILGLDQIATPATVDSPAGDLMTIIVENIAQLQSEGFEPNGIMLNPVTWAQIRNQRDDEVFLLGPPGSSLNNTLWGMPVFASPAVAQGDVFIGDWSQALLLDRQEVSVQAFEQHEDFARRNLVLLRCELRAGLAVPAPLAFRWYDAS